MIAAEEVTPLQAWVTENRLTFALSSEDRPIVHCLVIDHSWFYTAVYVLQLMPPQQSRPIRHSL